MTNIYEIAKEVSLSPTTVSLVLNGKGDQYRIAKKTQERIYKTAREMGYVANVSARRLVSNRISVYPEVALLWSPTQHPNVLNNFISILHKLEEEQQIQPFNVTIYPFRNGALDELEFLLTSNLVHGIIIPPARDEDIEYLKGCSYQVPAILQYGVVEGCYTVMVDNEKNGRDVADIFQARGFKRVGILEPGYVSRTAMERSRSFIMRCEENGMTLCYHGGEVQTTEMSRSNLSRYGAEMSLDLLKQKKLPEALFVQNDQVALGVISTLILNGVRIPEDISIICYGHTPDQFIVWPGPGLTLINYPLEEIAEKTIRLMSELLVGNPVKEKIFVCASNIEFSDSCTKPADWTL